MNSKQHVFNLFEAYLTYALDENHEQAQMGYLFKHGFNEDKFFSKYYVARKLKEDELEQAITNDNCHIFFVGQPGSGKTTLVRKVLHKVEQEQNVFVINVDFKKHSAVNRESKISFEAMQDYILKNIMASINAEIIKRKIDKRDVILELVANFNYLESNNFDNEEFINAAADANDEYWYETTSGDQEDFINWFREKLFRRKGDEFKELYQKLNTALKPQNLLYYLCAIKKIFPYCVLAFDNLDSIGDKELRKSFIAVFRQTFNVYKPTTKLIAIIRSRNIRMLTGDPGTYIINEIGLDYLEFNEGEEGVAKESSFVKAEKLKFQKKGKEKFAKLIYESRLQYLKNEVFKIDQVDMSEIEDYFDVVYNNERLRVSFFDLCNYDRRVMLIEISDFIRYLAFDLNIELSDANKNREQIDFALESLFYGWIKRKRKFYEDSIYNLPKDVNRWQQMSRQRMGCSIDHLIFACIFNLTGQDFQDYVFERQTTIEEVIAKMGEIGYQEEEIKSRIWYLYRDSETLGYKGLLEISSIEDPDPVKLGIKDYGISLTPRSYYMVVYSSLKYVSILADIYGEEVVAGNPGNIKELSDDTRPLTTRKLHACLLFLCNLAQMHLHGLMIARNKLYPKHLVNWFKFYRESFCIRPNPEDPYNDGGGELLFLNLIRSVSKFLKNQRLDPTEKNSRLINGLKPVIDELEKLEDLYEKEVKKLIQSQDETFPIKLFDFEKKIQFDIFNDR